MRDYYSILHLKPRAPLTKIKKLHRDLTLDFIDRRKRGIDSTAGFIKASQVFYVLKNLKRKQIYDALHEMYFGEEYLKDLKIIVKWKEKIKLAEAAGLVYAKELIELSDEELKKTVTEKRKNQSFNWLINIVEIILHFFFSFV